MNSTENTQVRGQDHKPWLYSFIAHWLSWQNHKENTDAEVPSTQLNIKAMQKTTSIPDYHGNTQAITGKITK